MRHAPFIIISSFFTLTACTQPPVTVDMRGSQDYSRNNSGSASSASYRLPVAPAPVTFGYSAPVSAPTEQTARLDSIGVSDLAPAANAEPAKVEAAAKAEPVKFGEAAPVNPWTHKPRETPIAASSVTDPKFIWPVTSKNVTGTFGTKGNDGINISAAEGEPVWAAADGEIVYADSKMKGYGKMVIVKHSGGKTTTYAHLARYGVEKYDRVKQGDIIGYVGTTGNAKKPQLYFSMRNGTQAIDPQKYVDRNVAGL